MRRSIFATAVCDRPVASAMARRDAPVARAARMAVSRLDCHLRTCSAACAAADRSGTLTRPAAGCGPSDPLGTRTWRCGSDTRPARTRRTLGRTQRTGRKVSPLERRSTQDSDLRGGSLRQPQGPPERGLLLADRSQQVAGPLDALGARVAHRPEVGGTVAGGAVGFGHVATVNPVATNVNKVSA